MAPPASHRAPSPAHMALLAEACSAEEGASSYSLAGGSTLVVQADGGCALGNLGSRPTCWAPPSECFSPSPPAFIDAAEVVGASAGGAAGALTIWHTGGLKGKEKPTRSLRQTTLRMGSSEAAAAAAHQIQQRACWRGGAQPPRVLVVINPASGPGRGPALYQKKVRPAFEAAGLSVAAHTTQRRGHATDLVRELKPGDWDVIVAIGGDGTMHEVLQGMLDRPDWDTMRRIPLAQIPCGSGNALAASTGMWDLDTAVHAVIKGSSVPLDVSSVVQAQRPRLYSFLSLTYGLIPCLDIGTEHLRWMGGTRFTVGAVQQIMMKKSYRARVAVLEAGEAGAAAEDGLRRDGGLAQPAEPGETQGPPLNHLAQFQAFSEEGLPDKWCWLDQAAVQLFSACNLPRLDMNSHVAPEAVPGNGHLDLIYTSKVGRMRGLQILLAAEQGQHLGLVQQKKVVAMALEPLSKGTWLVVDGEEIPFCPVFLEVHAGLCSALVAAS